MHDAKLFIKNIRFAAKYRNIPIGQLERDTDLSIGYLSRIAKGQEVRTVTLPTACRLADALNESLDDLVTKDYEALWRMGQLQAELRKKEEEIDRIKNEMESLTIRRFCRSLSDEEVRKVIKGWKEEA